MALRENIMISVEMEDGYDTCKDHHFTFNASHLPQSQRIRETRCEVCHLSFHPRDNEAESIWEKILWMPQKKRNKFNYANTY